jgi:hypothetical protein
MRRTLERLALELVQDYRRFADAGSAGTAHQLSAILSDILSRPDLPEEATLQTLIAAGQKLLTKSATVH